MMLRTFFEYGTCILEREWWQMLANAWQTYVDCGARRRDVQRLIHEELSHITRAPREGR